MPRVLNRFAAVLLLAPLLALAACDHRDEREEEPFFDDTPHIPNGGGDFGTFNQFEHDYADRTISDSHDLDGFAFSLAETSTVMITLTGVDSFDGFVDLYDGDLNFITGDDNGGPYTDPVLVLELDAGDYVAVAGGSDDSTGDYSIDILVSSIGGLDFEIVDPGNSYIDEDGFLDDSGDTDTYYFTILNDQHVDLRLTRLNGNYDGNLQLVDQFGQEIGYSDPSGTANPALINQDLGAGTYAVVVGCNAGDGAFRLRLDVD